MEEEGRKRRWMGSPSLFLFFFSPFFFIVKLGCVTCVRGEVRRWGWTAGMSRSAAIGRRGEGWVTRIGDVAGVGVGEGRTRALESFMFCLLLPPVPTRPAGAFFGGAVEWRYCPPWWPLFFGFFCGGGRWSGLWFGCMDKRKCPPSPELCVFISLLLLILLHAQLRMYNGIVWLEIHLFWL